MLNQPPSPTPAAPQPEWSLGENMRCRPKGWYWAAFPGAWVFYDPELNQVLGISHGDTAWHDLHSRRYWGPWSGANIPEDPANPGILDPKKEKLEGVPA